MYYTADSGRYNPQLEVAGISPLANPEGYAEWHGFKLINTLANGEKVFVEFEHPGTGLRTVVTGHLTPTRDDSDGMLVADLWWSVPGSGDHQLELACASEWLMEATLESM